MNERDATIQTIFWLALTNRETYNKLVAVGGATVDSFESGDRDFMAAKIDNHLRQVGFEDTVNVLRSNGAAVVVVCAMLEQNCSDKPPCPRVKAESLWEALNQGLD